MSETGSQPTTPKHAGDRLLLRGLRAWPSLKTLDSLDSEQFLGFAGLQVPEVVEHRYRVQQSGNHLQDWNHQRGHCGMD